MRAFWQLYGSSVGVMLQRRCGVPNSQVTSAWSRNRNRNYFSHRPPGWKRSCSAGLLIRHAERERLRAQVCTRRLHAGDHSHHAHCLHPCRGLAAAQSTVQIRDNQNRGVLDQGYPANSTPDSLLQQGTELLGSFTSNPPHRNAIPGGS